MSNAAEVDYRFLQKRISDQEKEIEALKKQIVTIAQCVEKHFHDQLYSAKEELGVLGKQMVELKTQLRRQQGTSRKRVTAVIKSLNAKLAVEREKIQNLISAATQSSKEQKRATRIAWIGGAALGAAMFKAITVLLVIL